MLIARSTDYAVRALKYMAQKKEGISAAELTRELKIPWPFMRKIMQSLGKSGLVSSRKGPGGGFRLEKAPEDVRLAELIEIFQGPVRLNECIFKKKVCCDKSTCYLSKKLGDIERHAHQILSNITLRQIIEGGD